MDTNDPKKRLAKQDFQKTLANFPISRLLLLDRRLSQKRVVRGTYCRGRHGCLLYWLSAEKIKTREQRIAFIADAEWAEYTSRLVDAWDGRYEAQYALDEAFVLELLKSEILRRSVTRLDNSPAYYKPGRIRSTVA